MDSIHTAVNMLIFCIGVIAVCVWVGLIIWLGIFMYCQLHHGEGLQNDISMVDLSRRSRRGNDISSIGQQHNEEVQV